MIGLLIVPLAVQWWSVYYPGSEPGGGGYIAQRMFAAKNENHSVGAVFFFNAAHFAVRPWPWIIVGLASLIVFPDIASMKEAFPAGADVAAHDMGYPAMLTFLPTGLIGLVLASLIAAYMSTISTHLNWGSSYLINDFYKRFWRPDASEKELVLAGRISTVLLMIFSGALALVMKSALDNFQILLQIGAGTGLIFILRWFWWRINAASEIAAMIISFLVAIYFQFFHHLTPLPDFTSWQELITGVVITTTGWYITMKLTRPTSMDKMVSFIKLVRPGGPGWKKIRKKAVEKGYDLDKETDGWVVPQGILCMVLGTIAVYGALLSTGYWIYSNIVPASILTLITVLASYFLYFAWQKLLSMRS